MGFVPAVMGVCAAAPDRDVYCVTGDGSLQMNIQEFATIRHHRFRAKVIVFNNDGYLLIRLTQKNFMDGRLIGEGPTSGVSFPELSKLAHTYDLGYVRIDREADVQDGIRALEAIEGPAICEVITPPQQLLVPRVASKRLEDGSMISMPYDDMFPFLPRDEYEANQAWKHDG
jgi:acetolactate synthase-1/2/3 large subunit